MSGSIRSIQLAEIIGELTRAQLDGSNNVRITGLTYDSRQVKPGNLFIAIPGLQKQGTEFIPDALSRGAAAVMTQDAEYKAANVPILRVPNARRAMAEAALSYFGHPERHLNLFAVTGTNGKTTVAEILRQVLESNGHVTGVIGTLGVSYSARRSSTQRTTPESVEIAEALSMMRASGVTHVAMEATSIGIDLERTACLPFRVAAFTNFTRDHLDYHGSMDRYLAAKLRLFSELPVTSSAIINADDPKGGTFAQACACSVTTYSVGGTSAITATNLFQSQFQTRFVLRTPGGKRELETPLVGRFNVSNVLAVVGAALSFGLPLDSIVEALRTVRPARGRMQVIRSNAPFSVVIDYAHTPDALENVLKAARESAVRNIIAVIGAGGDRDRGKRPLMGAAAARIAEKLIVTSDNPRTEDPDQIIDEIIQGIPSGTKYERDVNRESAIFKAIERAGNGDVVVIAGKGHETYQEIGTEQIPFDDAEVASRALTSRGFKS